MANLYKLNHPEKYREQRRRYDASEEGKAAKKRADAAYRATEKGKAALKRRAEKPVSEARKAGRRRWAQRNKWYSAYDRALRRRLGRMPISAVDKLEIRAMYQFCGAFPWFEVDHVVPIKGKNHSGLHVLGNLQVIETSLNKRKGNQVCPAYIELREHTPRGYSRG